MMMRVLFSRWLLSFLGVALLAALVWLFGPLLNFAASIVARGAILLVMLLAWAGINWWLDRRRRRRDAALQAGIVEAVDPAQSAAAEETAALRDRLGAALALLRRARGTRGYLYEQPWYAIIGPPGAGKTTALLNAGLQFPLAAEMGQQPLAGVGGTRLCEWMFTDQAVLIDTAGRYTTQDSEATVDRAGWEAFLDLLRRTRTRQPLNGVLVAISVTDVAAAPREERLAHARAIRRRLKEMEERLAVRLPVYALFTKADLISGFTEFFDDLDRERRAQVWGATFPLAASEAGPVDQFAAEFAALAGRLDARLLERMQAERSPDRRALIAGFPAQVASLQAPLAEFLRETFGGSRLDPAPLLRGVYLTSGTQEGSPIDRLVGALARTFGVDQRRAPSLRPERGRSYFLEGLLKSVVFGEAMLVSAKPGASRRRLLLRAGGYGLALLALLLGGGFLLMESGNNHTAIEQESAALAAYASAAGALRNDPVHDADLPAIVPLLDQARALPHGYDQPAARGWLLSQDDKLAAGARTVYRHALERFLLPRLLWRLEQQMRQNLDRPDFLYEATRVYLMLGGAGPMDAALVRAWMDADWQGTLPGATNAPLRADLGRHLAALLGEPLPPVELDQPLVAAARATFSRVPLASRVYSRIRDSATAQALPPWRPSGALGAAGVRFFTRDSGKSLTDGIPGFYTVAGLHTVLLPALGTASKQVAAESWVLDPRDKIAPTSPALATLEHDVVALYEQDYARQWDALLADLELAPLGSAQLGAQDLYVLASPHSPMRDLLSAIARQLTLSQPPSPPAGAAGAAQQAGQSAVSGEEARLKGLLGVQSAAAASVPPGKDIDDRYQTLRGFVGSGPGAPIDAVLKAMNDLQQLLAKPALPTAGVAVMATADDPAVALRAEAESSPPPVSRWLLALAAESTGLRAGGAKQDAVAAWRGSGGPAMLCQQAVAGRYPFSPDASAEIPLDDFSRLFAPGGLIDGYFNAKLLPFANMSTRVWRVQAANGVPPPLTAGALAQFQRAATIRDTFFGPGGTTPMVRFDLTPTDLDAAARQVTLDLGGTKITYAHGPVQPTSVVWPGANRMEHVQLSFDPPSPGAPASLEANGPWALFRLVNMGSLANAGSADVYLLSFVLGEHRASFQLRAGSVLNPFVPGLLQAFRCPNL